MKDTPKHSFEDEFRKAFEDAEATPSPKLWAQIDAELANKEASIYKRKLYIYKLRVAAAAVITFGFLGVWLLSGQFSGDTMAVRNQQTNGQQNNNSVGQRAGNKDITAPDKESENSALAQRSTTGQGKTTLESATSRSANEHVLAKENTVPAQEKNKSKITEQNTPPLIPETIALETSKGKTRNSTSGATEEKATVTNTSPATIRSNDKELNTSQQPAIVRTVPSPGGQVTAPDQSNNSLPPVNAKSDFANPVSKNSLAIRMNAEQDEPAKGNYSTYAFLRLTQPVQPLGNAIALQAPKVTVKPNNQVWIEEEKEIEGGQSASRWAVGLSFVPSQFNPNIQVNAEASASLSNARNTYYNRTAAPAYIGNKNALQNNTSVGKELEQAQSVNLSYNVGVDVGYALSEKFSLHSGLLYLHNNSQITTDNYLQNISNQEKYPEFMALIEPSTPNQNMLDFSNAPSPVSTPTANAFQHVELLNADKYPTSVPGVTEVMVYNTYQYISIPLSVHYILLDKKLSTAIGAGVSADLFVKNTIGNPEENIINQEFNRSSNGPYRDMSFSGLISAKVNYKISSKYSVYLQPSYRTALNSITNSALVSSRPNSFGIGTGFQYRF